MESNRGDGRSNEQMREIQLEQGLLSKADGSSRISVGKTRVIGSVYGPAESLQREELIEKAVIEVIVKVEELVLFVCFDVDSIWL